MRPVMSGKVSSYTEVAYGWTLEELLNFCELLDIQEDREKEEYDKSNKQ